MGRDLSEGWNARDGIRGMGCEGWYVWGGILRCWVVETSPVGVRLDGDGDGDGGV